MATKNRLAHKCKVCKKAFTGRKIDQLYCSARCCQRAYRARKAKEQPRKQAEVKPLNVVECIHCGGGFFAKTRRAQFCSTSCRTLHHRHLKAAIPAVLSDVWGIPHETALNVVDTQPIGKLRETLECLGYQYQHKARQWRGVADQP